MAVEKIIVATKKFNNNWWSIIDNNGREISISTINKKSQAAENQKIHGILVNANPGDEISIDVRDWQGKFYGNDPKEGGGAGGKGFVPKNQAREAALSAAIAAGNALSLQKDVSLDEFKKFATGVHEWIMSQSDK